VDTHPIHFHLFDVQVINRVTWDNIIIPPDANELGWKDTVRISPLEDTIVALRPVVPVVPFELPNSIRRLNPMMPLGSTAMFNNVDPNGVGTNAITNELVNFGCEYMYHCHILSHEEMDMMRPILLALPPIAPSGLSFKKSNKTLTWQDNSITETAFVIQKLKKGSTTWNDIGLVNSPLDQPNTRGARTFKDTAYTTSGPTVSYRVIAENTVGYGAEFPSMTVSSISSVLAAQLASEPVAPGPPAAKKTSAANNASAATGGCSFTGAEGSVSQALAICGSFFIIWLVGLGLKKRQGSRE
jgi:hypothetical protein